MGCRVAMLMHWPMRLRHPRMYRALRDHLDFLCHLHYVSRTNLYIFLRKGNPLGTFYVGREPGWHSVCIYGRDTGRDERDILEHEFTHYLAYLAGLRPSNGDIHDPQFRRMLRCVRLRAVGVSPIEEEDSLA